MRGVTARVSAHENADDQLLFLQANCESFFSEAIKAQQEIKEANNKKKKDHNRREFKKKQRLRLQQHVAEALLKDLKQTWFGFDKKKQQRRLGK